MPGVSAVSLFDHKGEGDRTRRMADFSSKKFSYLKYDQHCQFWVTMVPYTLATV